MSDDTPESFPLFKITRKEISFSNTDISSSISSNNFQEKPDNENTNNEISRNSDIILSMLFKNNKLGVAYYNINDRQLYFMQEMLELQPEFRITKNLIRQINPLHVVTIGSLSDEFVKSIIGVVTNTDENTLNSDQTYALPPNMTLLPFKVYSFEMCLPKVLDLNLASIPPNTMEKDREILLHSLIDLESKILVHTIGILIKFTEKNWTSFRGDNNTPLKFMHINKISLTDKVYIDHNTFTALQIFKVKSHDARFKRGGESSNKEGMGIFKLFSQCCKTKIGSLQMRYLMVNPTKDMTELSRRLDFIEFSMEPKNQGFIDNITDEIKHLTDLNKILVKIMYSKGKTNDWNVLYKTICHILCVNELCDPYRDSFPILRQLNSVVAEELYAVQDIINRTLELSFPNKKQRPHIKFGLDTDLDAKKLRLKDVAKTVTAAANFALDRLPHFLNECSVVYIPELGHLVSIRAWEPGCDKRALDDFGYQFVFEFKGNLLYKNDLCKELDVHLGEIQQQILTHETAIIQKLSTTVLRFNKNIRESLRILSMIDCLLAMGTVAKEGTYVRPRLNDENFHEILNGRHPIFEINLTNFVPNDYRSGGRFDGRVKILTGPNSGGKSVYLKQVAVLVYLAHIGSYLPVESATIGLVDSIYSRISATETASVPLSAFMIDIIQISSAIHNAKKSSLVLIDEFGRGTSGDDGQALLASALTNFIKQDENCPHIIVSTHYQNLYQYLPHNSRLLTFLKMNYILDDEKKIIFLYKIAEGVSSSFAFNVATAAGLRQEIVQRASIFYEALRNDRPIEPLPQNLPLDYRLVNLDDKKSFNTFLLNINIPQPDI